MAFNFLGTIKSIEEFEEFEEFINIELVKIDNRIKHLNKEKNRFYELMDRFKIADLKLRSEYNSSDQPDADWIENPRPSTAPKRASIDALNAVDVDILKKTFLDAIKYKRERNEFKIKRIRDLLEQFNDEILMLEEKKESTLDTIEKIRSRFDLTDFAEVQRTADLDPADVQSGIRAIAKDAGREVVKNIIYYYVLSINGTSKSITFENIAPAVKVGDKLVLSNGNNNGTKTVKSIVNSRTLEIYESITTENPSNTKVIIQK